MRGKFGPASEVLREQLAQEAARLITEHGINDYGQAKRRAAARFGVRNAGALPSNTEIELSVIERQRIFDPDLHESRVTAMRIIAIEIMEMLDEFQPRLVGPVLAGTVTESSPVELHVYTDSPECVLQVLDQSGINSRDYQRRYRLSTRHESIIPGFRFRRQGEPVYVLTFPEKGLRQPPISPVDRRPIRRAARHRVAALLDEKTIHATKD